MIRNIKTKCFKILKIKLTCAQVRNFQNKIMIFITYNIHTIVFIFIVIFITFQPMRTLAFFRCLMLNSRVHTELQLNPVFNLQG